MITYLLKSYQGTSEDFYKLCCETYGSLWFGVGENLGCFISEYYPMAGLDATKLVDEMLAGVDQTSIPMLVKEKARAEKLQRMQEKAAREKAAREKAAREKAAREKENSIEGQVDKALNKVFNLF